MLQSRIIEHQAVKEGWSPEKLKETGKQYWHLKALQDIADRKFETMTGFRDYTEIELKFLINWPDKQKLPESHRIEEMFFDRLAHVTDDEITEGCEAVRKREAAGEWFSYLANDWEPTKNKVDSRYKEDLANREAELTKSSYPLLKKLDDEKDQQMKKLAEEKQTRSTGSSPMTGLEYTQRYTQRTKAIETAYNGGAAAIQANIDEGMRQYRTELLEKLFDAEGAVV